MASFVFLALSKQIRTFWRKSLARPPLQYYTLTHRAPLTPGPAAAVHYLLHLARTFTPDFLPTKAQCNLHSNQVSSSPHSTSKRQITAQQWVAVIRMRLPCCEVISAPECRSRNLRCTFVPNYSLFRFHHTRNLAIAQILFSIGYTTHCEHPAAVWSLTDLSAPEKISSSARHYVGSSVYDHQTIVFNVMEWRGPQTTTFCQTLHRSKIALCLSHLFRDPDIYLPHAVQHVQSKLLHYYKLMLIQIIIV